MLMNSWKEGYFRPSRPSIIYIILSKIKKKKHYNICVNLEDKALVGNY